jgi:hypothetical protein
MKDLLPLFDVEIDLVCEHVSFNSIGAYDHMGIILFVILSGNESEFDLVDSSDHTLNNPSTDLATVVLNLLGQALSHADIKVCLPVGLVEDVLIECVDILVDRGFILSISECLVSMQV